MATESLTENLISLRKLNPANLSEDDLARADYSEFSKYGVEGLEKIYNKLTEIKNGLAKAWEEEVGWEENKQRAVEGNLSQIGQGNQKAEELQKRIRNLETFIDKLAIIRNEKATGEKKQFDPKALVASLQLLSEDLEELDEETAQKMYQILNDNIGQIATRNELAQNSKYEDDYYEAIKKLETKLGIEKVQAISSLSEISINHPELINVQELNDQEKLDVLKRLRMRSNSNSLMINDAMDDEMKDEIRQRILASDKDPDDYTWTRQHHVLMSQLEEYFQKKDENRFDNYVSPKDRQTR